MREMNCQALVIGSGPGGQITAHRLLEAGLGVIMIEQGRSRLDAGNPTRHSWQEVCQMYAGAGANPAFGKRPLNIAEASCVGGGAEINAGLYWRLPDEERARWETDLGLTEFSAEYLNATYTNLERQIEFAANTEEGISQRLADGCSSAGMIYAAAQKTANVKWSRPENLLSQTFVQEFICRGGKVISAVLKTPLGPASIKFDHLFLCAGATGTPRILRQSKWNKSAGQNIQMHPMMKLIAEFADPIHSLKPFVESGQATSQMHTKAVFGCSLSSSGFLAAALAEQQVSVSPEELQRFCIYNVHISAVGSLSLSCFNNSLLISKMESTDTLRLRQGLDSLATCLSAAGAKRFFKAPQKSISGTTALHLFAGCALNSKIVDGFGKLKGFTNVRVNDASMIPRSPVVNPQGTLMALAWRNMDDFISESM